MLQAPNKSVINVTCLYAGILILLPLYDDIVLIYLVVPNQLENT